MITRVKSVFSRLMCEEEGATLVEYVLLVALVGVEDLVIVDTADALLIAHRDCAQHVGGIVDRLEEKKREDLI